METNGLLYSGESNLFGSHKRKKLCKEAGLTGMEKRDCAKQLKASGWKKGQPIPASMSGITQAEAVVLSAPAPASAPSIVTSTTGGGVSDSAVNSGGSEAAAGGTGPVDPAPEAAKEVAPAPEKSKTMYVIIGVVVLVVIVVAAMMMKKKPA